MPQSLFLTPWKGVPVMADLNELRPAHLVDTPTVRRNRARILVEQMDILQAGRLEDLRALPYFKRPRHIVVAGATGEGIGFALACALSKILCKDSSLTLLSADPEGSVGYFTGDELVRRAFDDGRISLNWLNVGMDRKVKDVVNVLKSVAANGIVYFHCVFKAHLGHSRGFAPIWIPHLHHRGELRQWQTVELTSKQEEENLHFMGRAAIRYPEKLRQRGIDVSQEHYMDFRATLDHRIRLPAQPTYGRWGVWATCLWLPKDQIHQHVERARREGSGRHYIHFLPTLLTTSLRGIPGGTLQARIYEKIQIENGIRPLTTAEVALDILEKLQPSGDTRRSMRGTQGSSAFVYHDTQESRFDHEAFEVLAHCHDPDSPHYYQNWVHL